MRRPYRFWRQKIKIHTHTGSIGMKKKPLTIITKVYRGGCAVLCLVKPNALAVLPVFTACLLAPGRSISFLGSAGNSPPKTPTQQQQVYILLFILHYIKNHDLFPFCTSAVTHRLSSITTPSFYPFLFLSKLNKKNNHFFLNYILIWYMYDCIWRLLLARDVSHGFVGINPSSSSEMKSFQSRVGMWKIYIYLLLI